MIRGVVTVFGLVAMLLIVMAGIYFAARFAGWATKRWHARRFLNSCRKEERKP